MDKPANRADRISVDFNKMLRKDEVALSLEDTKLDASENMVTFYEGMPVGVYESDVDEHGEVDNLIADGIALPNKYPWAGSVKWLLKINELGVYYESNPPKNAKENAPVE